jgi:hypothetical protein
MYGHSIPSLSPISEKEDCEPKPEITAKQKRAFKGSYKDVTFLLVGTGIPDGPKRHN